MTVCSSAGPDQGSDLTKMRLCRFTVPAMHIFRYTPDVAIIDRCATDARRERAMRGAPIRIARVPVERLQDLLDRNAEPDTVNAQTSVELASARFGPEIEPALRN
jgi:hypothetical protein